MAQEQRLSTQLDVLADAGFRQRFTPLIGLAPTAIAVGIFGSLFASQMRSGNGPIDSSFLIGAGVGLAGPLVVAGVTAAIPSEVEQIRDRFDEAPHATERERSARVQRAVDDVDGFVATENVYRWVSAGGSLVVGLSLAGAGTYLMVGERPRSAPMPALGPAFLAAGVGIAGVGAVLPFFQRSLAETFQELIRDDPEAVTGTRALDVE
jgi:hypothetical protein